MSGVDLIPQIHIYAKDKTVGVLSFEQPGVCSLQHAQNWLDSGYAMSPHLPLNQPAQTQSVINFIRNLFPEGGAFDTLLESENISAKNVYAILKIIGSDTVGAFTFSVGDATTDIAQLMPIDKSELIRRLAAGADLSTWEGKFRLSVAGVQNKLNVYKDAGALYLPGSTFASNYIVKSASANYPTIVANEFYCMRLAKAIQLDVADVWLQHFGEHSLLLVKRFDRRDVSGGVEKRHIIDGCQALDLRPEFKYEKPYGSHPDVAHIRTGASLHRLFNFANQTAVPALTKQRLIDWLVFNLIIGNGDAHAKNISFYVSKNGMSVAPFYDLVSIRYEAINNEKMDTDLAMAIGENFDIDAITAFDLLSFAQENEIKFDLLKRRIERLAVICLNHAHRLDFSNDNLRDSQVAVHQDIAALVCLRCELLLKQSRQFSAVIKGGF